MGNDMTQLAIDTRVNKNLFSNHYLDNLIQRNPEWQKEDHREAFQKIMQIYQREMAFLEGGEAALAFASASTSRDMLDLDV